MIVDDHLGILGRLPPEQVHARCQPFVGLRKLAAFREARGVSLGCRASFSKLSGKYGVASTLRNLTLVESSLV